ncbi:hypothetical protein [Phenylobacterium sp.]|uniref:hypothetical protein n=1 Tax=Phenylobacterium sp. TaxID=1871053 RepID=UPI00289D9640|nr:hypothetical protein [Phenylobacterium sp.]
MGRILFRSKPVFTPLATLITGVAGVTLVTAMALLDEGAWHWAVGAFALAGLGALAGVAARFRLVTELAPDGEALLARTLFQRHGSPPIRIPVAEARGWREYVEVRRGFGLTTVRNRMLAFRHRGVAYGMALDHAEVLDRAGLDAVRTQAP